MGETESEASSSMNVRARGGDATLCMGSGFTTTCDQSAWLQSIEPANMVPVDFKIKLWSDFFRDYFDAYYGGGDASSDFIVDGIEAAIRRHAANSVVLAPPAPPPCGGMIIAAAISSTVPWFLLIL